MKKEVREDIKIIKYAITFIFVICAVVSMYEICFNPCFNGYYTSTRPKSNHCNHTYTAILKIYNLQKIYQKTSKNLIFHLPTPPCITVIAITPTSKLQFHK